MHKGYTCASLILTHPVVLPSLVCLRTEDGGVEETQILEIRKKPFFSLAHFICFPSCVLKVFLAFVAQFFSVILVFVLFLSSAYGLSAWI